MSGKIITLGLTRYHCAD